MRYHDKQVSFPPYTNLLLSFDAGVLYITLNRIKKRNALNEVMVGELIDVFETARPHRTIRAIVLRGAGGHFCAGGDLSDMGRNTHNVAAQKSEMRNLNRRFGELSAIINCAPQVVVMLLEGAVLGGGVGMACVCDVAIADIGAQIAMPETTLGIVPAQIAAFVVERIGLTHAKRLALLGETINGEEACQLGMVQYVTDTAIKMDAQLHAVLQKIKRCAPHANAATKKLMQDLGSNVNETTIDHILDRAADSFIESLYSEEGQEGIRAFMAKRSPGWMI